jgi:hypothetical protein
MCREEYKSKKHIESFCKFLLQIQAISSLWPASNDVFDVFVYDRNSITDVYYTCWNVK